MKNFNFKLDIDEIDRIIEEDDSMIQDENQHSNSKKSQEEFKQEVMIDVQPDVIKNEVQRNKRKGWGPKQVSPINKSNVYHPESAEKSPSKPGRNLVAPQGGFRMNRTPDLQTSSTDPILALLNKQQNRNDEESKHDMPQQRNSRSP